MEAKELMIGDWVECVDSTHKKKVYAQIDAIEEGQTCILVRLDNCNWFLDISFIKPIPLTCEIIEKNGFVEWMDKCYRWEYAEGIYINIDFTEEEPWAHISNRCYSATPVCRYVHELQHAFKLCGVEKEMVL